MQVTYSSTYYTSVLCENDDEARTIYFALKEYRDNLVNSLIELARKEFDSDDYFEASALNEKFEGTGVISKVLELNDNVALGWEKGCNAFEDLMFLHETLAKVNAALFALIDDNNLGRNKVDARLGVI